MKRVLYILLALSLGLNAGMLYVQVWNRAEEPVRWPPQGAPPASMNEMGPIGHPGGPEGFVRDRLARVADRLNLSDEQVESMSAILGETMPDLLDGRDTIRGLRMEMREEYLKPQVDAERIQNLRRETAAVQSRLDSIMVDTMLQEAKLLTPEQREAYFDLMPFGDKGKRGSKMHGGRMRRGRGWRNKGR